MQTGTSGVTTDSNQRLAQSAAPKPRPLDQVRQSIGARHYSKRTEKTYVPAPIRDENGKSEIENGKWQMVNGKRADLHSRVEQRRARSVQSSGYAVNAETRIIPVGLYRKESVANASESLHQLSKDNQFNDQTISGLERPSRHRLMQKESSG